MSDKADHWSSGSINLWIDVSIQTNCVSVDLLGCGINIITITPTPHNRQNTSLCYQCFSVFCPSIVKDYFLLLDWQTSFCMTFNQLSLAYFMSRICLFCPSNIQVRIILELHWSPYVTLGLGSVTIHPILAGCSPSALLVPSLQYHHQPRNRNIATQLEPHLFCFIVTKCHQGS